MDVLLATGQLLLLVAIFSVGLIVFVMADLIARFNSWVIFSTPFGWRDRALWGDDNPNFTREGFRTVHRWGFRLFGLGWMAFVALGVYMSAQ
jgi:hypothetical protein